MTSIIIFCVSSLLTGFVIGAAIVHLYHSEKTRTMKADTTVALSEQAIDSYRHGYMRGMIDEKAIWKNKESARSTMTQILSTF